MGDYGTLPANPIVSPTPDDRDAAACYNPSVIRDEKNNRWLLRYNGRYKFSEYIGQVIHEGLDPGLDPGFDNGVSAEAILYRSLRYSPVGS